jgi:hypothetical protein
VGGKIRGEVCSYRNSDGGTYHVLFFWLSSRQKLESRYPNPEAEGVVCVADAVVVVALVCCRRYLFLVA